MATAPRAECLRQPGFLQDGEKTVRNLDYHEARRRLLAYSQGERDAWVHAHRRELRRQADDACRNHNGMLDSQRDAWTQLVLATVPDWQTPACRSGEHDKCVSGRCTCNCEHVARKS